MLFWDGPPIDPQKSPVAAADALFGGQHRTPPPVDYDVQLRKDLLALTRREVQACRARCSGLTSEQNKLATHLDVDAGAAGRRRAAAAHESVARQAQPAHRRDRAHGQRRQRAESSGGNDYFYQAEELPVLLQAQLELVEQDISATPRTSSA